MTLSLQTVTSVPVSVVVLATEAVSIIVATTGEGSTATVSQATPSALMDCTVQVHIKICSGMLNVHKNIQN